MREFAVIAAGVLLGALLAGVGIVLVETWSAHDPAAHAWFDESVPDSGPIVR